MLDEKTTRRLFDEEAEKLGITLGAQHSINWQIHQNATEAEARATIAESLIASLNPTIVDNLRRLNARWAELQRNPQPGVPEWDDATREVVEAIAEAHKRASTLH